MSFVVSKFRVPISVCVAFMMFSWWGNGRFYIEKGDLLLVEIVARDLIRGVVCRLSRKVRDISCCHPELSFIDKKNQKED